MGYAGHFDDATIEEIRRHPDVSSNPSFLLRRIWHYRPRNLNCSLRGPRG
jgi:hypothetical protein